MLYIFFLVIIILQRLFMENNIFYYDISYYIQYKYEYVCMYIYIVKNVKIMSKCMYFIWKVLI